MRMHHKAALRTNVHLHHKTKMLVLPKVLSIVFLIKGIRIYKVFISLLQQTKLCVKHELEIEGV